MIIDENQLSSVHNILNKTKFKKQVDTPPPFSFISIDQERAIVNKPSNYFSIG